MVINHDGVVLLWEVQNQMGKTGKEGHSFSHTDRVFFAHTEARLYIARNGFCGDHTRILLMLTTIHEHQKLVAFLMPRTSFFAFSSRHPPSSSAAPANEVASNSKRNNAEAVALDAHSPSSSELTTSLSICDLRS